MSRLRYLLLLLLLPPLAVSLYSPQDDVVILSPSNYDRLVIDDDQVWIVEFFAPWCGHCKSFASEYKAAATALKGVVKVGAVDVDQHQELGQRYSIQGFPTVKIFGLNKNKPEDYNGARSVQGLIDAAFSALRKKVDAQSGKKSGGRSQDSSGDSGGGDVIELTDSNFDETVFNSNDMWLVEFYAPWCGHCKNLEPQWKAAARELKGKVKVAAVDATVHTRLAGKYNIRGFPTIKYFPAGKKDSSSAEDYDGGRTSGDIVNWALDKVVADVPAPELVQITSSEILNKACDNHQLCIISVLPHILDCQSKCRNDYLDTLKKLGEKFKKNLWGWVWVEGGAQSELESGLGIGGFGYPAMAAVNARKMKYAILRGSFSFDGINEFLREVAFGRGSTQPLKGTGLPNVTPSDPWDGKDGELPVEEDIDLEDETEKTEL